MSIASSSVTVTADQIQSFEPSGLGPLAQEYRRILRSIDGQPQSSILSVLEREVRRLPDGRLDAESHALRVTLLVLRDYVVAGHYPLVRGSRCYLANVSDSNSLSQEQQREVLKHRYQAARERALRDRGQLPWLDKTAKMLAGQTANYHLVVDTIGSAPPAIALIDTRVGTPGRDVPARDLWRAVRATWSMGPEASAPGREAAFLVVDERWPNCPLAVLQFRNVVPEISARDLWLGVSAGSIADGPRRGGFLGKLADRPALIAHRAAGTLHVLEELLRNVRRDGIGVDLHEENIDALNRVARSSRELFNLHRRLEPNVVATTEHLDVVKRAQTASALLRGIRVLKLIVAEPSALMNLTEVDVRDLDVGLGKLWHYHMGFVALEMSICGAAPPFGPLRLGKLAASLAGSEDVALAWGDTRPLGSIAQSVYHEAVRAAVPNPGPLIVFTSGLFPGHSAQYNRVASGNSSWAKIGETSGFGSFHISPETADAMRDLNASIDGYEHITRTFGEGSGAKFRSIGRALGYLGLPDFRQHETRRPLYALPLVQDPQGVLLGWADASVRTHPTLEDLSEQWWNRWVGPSADALVHRARLEPGLAASLFDMAARVRHLG